jgi:uncharacterized protein YeaO (DUF488 family)
MKNTPKLRTFCYTDPPKRGEGLRIGTTRRPPRGVPKKRWGEFFDVWFPVVAPSEELLRKRPFGFARYKREVLGRAESRQAVELLAALARRTPISIGCFCATEEGCHRSYLRRIIQEMVVKAFA